MEGEDKAKMNKGNSQSQCNITAITGDRTSQNDFRMTVLVEPLSHFITRLQYLSASHLRR